MSGGWRAPTEVSEYEGNGASCESLARLSKSAKIVGATSTENPSCSFVSKTERVSRMTYFELLMIWKVSSCRDTSITLLETLPDMKETMPVIAKKASNDSMPYTTSSCVRTDCRRHQSVGMGTSTSGLLAAIAARTERGTSTVAVTGVLTSKATAIGTATDCVTSCMVGCSRQRFFCSAT